MEPKLVVELYVYHNVVIGKVVFMSEELEQKCGAGTIFRGSNGFTIDSSGYPELGWKSLIIRGVTQRFDNQTIGRTFSCPDTAMKYALDIKLLVEEFNGCVYDNANIDNMERVI